MRPYASGDRWTLLNGDCIEVMRGLPVASVAAVVTSPPYAEQRRKFYGGICEAEYPAWTVAWMEQVRRVLSPSGSVLINIREHVRDGQISDYVHRSRLALREAGWIECDELIWVKPLAPPVGHPYRPRRSWERVLWFSPSRRPWCDPKANGTESNCVGMTGGLTSWVSGMSRPRSGTARCRDVAIIPIVKTRRPHWHKHPAAYPCDLAAWLCRLVTPPGGLVLDPFAGSGTTLLAAAQDGYHAVGIEQSEAYCEIAARRLSATVPEALAA